MYRERLHATGSGGVRLKRPDEYILSTELLVQRPSHSQWGALSLSDISHLRGIKHRGSSSLSEGLGNLSEPSPRLYSTWLNAQASL